MKVQPVASPHAMSPQTNNAPAARERAMAAFLQQPQQPVQNQNAIAAEEMGAIKTAPQEGEDETTPGVDAQVAETTEELEAASETEPKSEEPPQKDPELTKQFAQLARQERALREKARAQEQALAEKERTIEKQLAAIKEKEAQYTSGYISKDQLKKNALAVLADAGVSYDDITQQLLNQQPTDPRVEATISRLEAKIAELEKKNEEVDTRFTESQKQQYEAAKQQIGREVKTLVSKDPNFELIKHHGADSDVVELIVKTFEEDGTLMSVEEAAEEVERYLEEESLKLTKLQKIQKKLQPATPASNTPEAVKSAAKTLAEHAKSSAKGAQPGQTQPGIKTLTNKTGVSRQLSAKERAILAFKGELK